jgi:hypothetical protein
MLTFVMLSITIKTIMLSVAWSLAPYRQTLDQGEKKLLRDERSSLLRHSVGGEVKKGFMTLTPSVNVIKLSSFVTDDKAQ